MKKMKFVWIDDKRKKVESFREVIESGVDSMKASISLIEVKRDVLEVLATWAGENKANPPDLIIIDHIYDLSLPFGLKGSSVAHLLRSEIPSVPMVCVTAMFDRAQSFDQEDISEYTALFLYQQLERHIEDLYAIARDFGKLDPANSRKPAGGAREHFVSSLKAPRRDHVDLLRVMPEEFRDEKHATTEHRVARWIFNVLRRRPGFLYDRMHAATLLGLTETGFQKVEHLFEKAKYKGVFATGHDPRWWVSSLRDTLFSLLGDEAPDLPQYAGRTLPGVVADDFSVCYISKKVDPAPDAVVATDTTPDAAQRVVRTEFSDAHPLDAGVTPGFEARLVLRRAKK